MSKCKFTALNSNGCITKCCSSLTVQLSNLVSPLVIYMLIIAKSQFLMESAKCWIFPDPVTFIHWNLWRFIAITFIVTLVQCGYCETVTLYAKCIPSICSSLWSCSPFPLCRHSFTSIWCFFSAFCCLVRHFSAIHCLCLFLLYLFLFFSLFFGVIGVTVMRFMNQISYPMWYFYPCTHLAGGVLLSTGNSRSVLDIPSSNTLE